MDEITVVRPKIEGCFSFVSTIFRGNRAQPIFYWTWARDAKTAGWTQKETRENENEVRETWILKEKA
jgi:hypothetical protein